MQDTHTDTSKTYCKSLDLQPVIREHVIVKRVIVKHLHKPHTCIRHRHTQAQTNLLNVWIRQVLFEQLESALRRPEIIDPKARTIAKIDVWTAVNGKTRDDTMANW